MSRSLKTSGSVISRLRYVSHTVKTKGEDDNDKIRSDMIMKERDRLKEHFLPVSSRKGKVPDQYCFGEC